MTQDDIIRLPNGEPEFSLTPKVWLALGILVMNHQLLTRTGLRVLTPSQTGTPVSEERLEAVKRGLAALVDIDRLTPEQRYAFVALAQATLNPLGVYVSVHGSVPPGAAPEKRYMAIADTGGTSAFQLPDGEPDSLCSKEEAA